MSVQALGWVLDHSPSKGTDRLILIAIANHAGQSPVDGAWEAWPGTALLQREAGLDRDRTVNDALARLVGDGAIDRAINGAPDMRMRADRRPNLYRILLDHGVTCGDTRCRWCGVTPDDERGDASRPDGVTRDDVTGCRDASPKPSVNRNTKPKEQPLPLTVISADPDEAFTAFYTAYPRKTARGDARKAWPAAVKAAGEADRIIAGATRYAADPNRDPAYTKYPAAWLRAECWDDEPLPRRKNTPQTADGAMASDPNYWGKP